MKHMEAISVLLSHSSQWKSGAGEGKPSQVTAEPKKPLLLGLYQEKARRHHKLQAKALKHDYPSNS